MHREKKQPFLETPRTITKQIESYIAKNAWEDECRAHKALILLKARDKKIAYLEKRVFELENATTQMHALYLQRSQTMSSMEISNKESCIGRYQSNKVFDVQDNKTESDVSSKNLLSDLRNSSSDEKNLPFSTSNLLHPVPTLKLPALSTSNSEKDVYSTPATVLTQGDFNRLKTLKQNKAEEFEQSYNCESHDLTDQISCSNFLEKETDSSFEKLETQDKVIIDQGNLDDYLLTNCNTRGNQKVLKEVSGSVCVGQSQISCCSLNLIVGIATVSRSEDPSWTRIKGSPINDLAGNKTLEKSPYVIQQTKSRSMFPARASSSVPWIRMKRNFRKKKRGGLADSRLGRTENVLQTSKIRGFKSGKLSLAAPMDVTSLDTHVHDPDRDSTKPTMLDWSSSLLNS
ncbi:uncharacterized protein LOC117178747 isoform X2 [Belonocnema kinseyi]|nr:uncharacterized protein LOC117178747 isoform X2 [Belonocnema kinseyi]